MPMMAVTSKEITAHINSAHSLHFTSAPRILNDVAILYTKQFYAWDVGLDCISRIYAKEGLDHTACAINELTNINRLVPGHDRRIAVLRVLLILRLGTGTDIGPGALFAVCALSHFIVNSFLAYINPGLIVTIQPMVASVWSPPPIIGRL